MMRWKKNKDGDERIVRKFLLFPVTIRRETRWLEKSKIRQIYSVYPFSAWENVEFIDEEKE